MTAKAWFKSTEVSDMIGYSVSYIRDLIRKDKKIHKKNFKKKDRQWLLRMPEAAFDMRANILLGRNGPAVERAELTAYLSAFPDSPGRPAHKPPDKSKPIKRDKNDAVSALGFGALSLNDAKEEQARQKAAELKMKNDKQAGALVDKSVVERQAFEAARLTRDSILKIPSRIGAELASITDVHLVIEKLTAELTQALENIADEL